MTIQRLTPVAVLLAAVLAIGTEAVKAQETVNIAVPVSIPLSSGTDFVTITGAVNGTWNFTTFCSTSLGFGSGHEGLKAVILNREVPPAAFVLRSAYLSSPVPPGTRLVDFSPVGNCTDGGSTFNIFEATLVHPRNLDIALVTTPPGITLDEGHEVVVGAGTDEDGIADAVCVKKGEKSLKTEIISDIPLELGDRLTDFLEFDFDPDTGETTYAAWLEY